MIEVRKDSGSFKLGDELCRTVVFENDDGYRFRLRLEQNEYRIRTLLDREIRMGKYEMGLWSKVYPPNISFKDVMKDVDKNGIPSIAITYDIDRVVKQRYAVRMFLSRKKKEKEEEEE